MEFYIPKKESTISYLPLIQTGYKSKFLPFKSLGAYIYIFYLWHIEYRVPWSPAPTLLHPGCMSGRSLHTKGILITKLCARLATENQRKPRTTGREWWYMWLFISVNLLSHLKRHAAVWQESMYSSSLTFSHVEGDCITGWLEDLLSPV